MLGAGYFDITQKNGEEDGDEKKKKKVAGEFSILKNAYVGKKEVCKTWKRFLLNIKSLLLIYLV